MASIWDGDDIAKAVEKAKKSKAIFVIFVEGKDEVSAHLAELFEHEKIVEKMKTDRFVAIRVEENSQMHKFFIEVYPQELSPFVCYVGSEGYVLEWITKKLSLEEFSNTIDGILERDGCSPKKDDSKILIEKEKESVVSSTTEISAIASDLKVKKEEEEVEAKGVEGGKEESSIRRDIKEKELEQSPSSSKELSQEEKVHHAKELIEQIKEEKRKQEEEAERQKEIERRKMGQNVQQMKRWQEDEKIKQMMEERDREKKENQAARDRVLAQIAQDKVERAARFAKQGSASAPSIPRASPEVNKVVPKSNTTKLQFRLPEGSVYTHDFQISDTLQTVHQYIMNELNLPFINYTISTTFPRREFNDADSSQTLLDLQLVPNAVVLILPQAQGSSPSGGAGGMLGAVFWWMMAPLMSMYDFLVGFIFGAPSIGKGDQQPAAAKRSASEAEVTSRNQPKRQAGNTTEIKKQGNIHRLKERPDTDDENNTWNGNSTQQM